MLPDTLKFDASRSPHWSRPSVCIVDDSRISRKALREILEEADYAVREAPGGAEGLALAKADPPDLFLLDVLMPEMDGFELCQKLKSEEALADIPVIFITSLDRPEEMVRGFQVGAVDYILKPFQRAAVLCHVRTHILLHQAMRENERYAAEMEKLAGERARALLHAERLATLGTLSAGLAHEINNPTAVISGNLQMLRRVWPSLETVLRRTAKSGEENREGTERDVAFALAEMDRLLADMETGVDRIQRLVRSLKGFSRKDRTLARAVVPLGPLLDNVLLLCDNRLKRLAGVERDLPAGLPAVQGVAHQIEQVLVNLLLNAADAMEGQADARLLLRARPRNRGVEIAVEDNGPGIPEEALSRMWEAFYTTKSEEKGTGLGLAISRGIVEEHGGTLAAENRPEGGARFLLWLPAAENP